MWFMPRVVVSWLVWFMPRVVVSWQVWVMPRVVADVVYASSSGLLAGAVRPQVAVSAGHALVTDI